MIFNLKIRSHNLVKVASESRLNKLISIQYSNNETNLGDFCYRRSFMTL